MAQPASTARCSTVYETSGGFLLRPACDAWPMNDVASTEAWAVVSDLHGNLTALDAVTADLARRGVREVVHGGDLALIGARPASVVDRVRDLGWPGVLGNTDELLFDPHYYQQVEA